MLIGVVFATSEIVREKVAFSPLVDLISMTNIDAIHVCDPRAEYVCPTKEEGVKRFSEVSVEVASWKIPGTAGVLFAGFRLKAEAFFSDVVFFIRVKDMIIAVFPEVKDHVEGPLDDVGGP